MAAALKVMSRLSSRLHHLSHTKLSKQSSLSLHLKPNPSTSTPRVSPISRLPVELGSLDSMLPLHSAVASSRLVSSLSIDSLAWGLVPQDWSRT
ncbi:hypothetical protein TanjilG_21024 [Lupinus angustifolius]|uniref:Uncharacterized protein n=1 Tax=Lupinus angustifolius TaxID=3871 RepID=A0A1J7FZL5_LUPAN|nr:hypothetical protein TanjilG_21024 [Lupinus angustifolius]